MEHVVEHIISRDELDRNATGFRRFEGHRFGGINVSLYPSFANEGMPPGSGPRLHRHPYPEVFVVHDGRVTFTVGDRTVEASGGAIVVVPAGISHKFVNCGESSLHMTAIQLNERMIGEWLEDEPRQ